MFLAIRSFFFAIVRLNATSLEFRLSQDTETVEHWLLKGASKMHNKSKNSKERYCDASKVVPARVCHFL